MEGVVHLLCCALGPLLVLEDLLAESEAGLAARLDAAGVGAVLVVLADGLDDSAGGAALGFRPLCQLQTLLALQPRLVHAHRLGPLLLRSKGTTLSIRRKQRSLIWASRDGKALSFPLLDV